eukprot:TRINITY_DN36089_c0_g1_i2.p1 TRINITY_DN36089_c0_g1~~TRINITY_DN36089_c0_g1_i2.p1  ORF type:complete len:455 (+),score=27.12 TRINITY_DN36089_c0_g1_i2:71-1435(+)
MGDKDGEGGGRGLFGYLIDPDKYELLLVLCLCLAFAPWLRVMLKRPDAGTARRQPSSSFLQHAEGRAVWAVLLLVGFVCLFVHLHVHKTEGVKESLLPAYILCWLGSFVIIGYTWYQVGRPNAVPPGLVANFFIWGGLLGVFISVVLNSDLMISWLKVSPQCNMAVMMEATWRCNALAATMWVLTPGLVEETFKAIWLFFRLRKAPDDFPGDGCLGWDCAGLPARYPLFGPVLRFIASLSDCRCWFKLAPTPAHVLLCAMACGAGFGCLENVMYVFCKTGTVTIDTAVCRPDANMMQKKITALTIASTRVATSALHIVWTALIGIGLSRRMFSPPEERPWIITIVAPSMLTHGLYDYAVSAMQSVKLWERLGQVVPLWVSPGLLLLCCFTCLSPCGCLAYLTGCCLRPDFWRPRAQQFVGPGIELLAPQSGQVLFQESQPGGGAQPAYVAECDS